MVSLTLKLPAMYADHHVVEVRRILSELLGIGDIYASSAFQSAEIKFDPSLTDTQEIERVLNAAGYLGEIPIPAEIGAQIDGENGRPFFRHSTAYTQAGKTVSFAQNVPFSGRPLWPCPGFGTIEKVTVPPKEAKHA
ncbi:MAG: heavy-metal-associated domain-containing protein [Anaerolineae bacterium]|nr:heavy-metal-associated domain-containing protein [Anaerolineae bacterium]